MKEKNCGYENVVENVVTDEERALYGIKNTLVKNVRFDGPADGESAVKECDNVTVEKCFCNLRYPFWHVRGLKMIDTEMTVNCRASVWYTDNLTIENCKLHGPKIIRECNFVKVSNCDINSIECGWWSHHVTFEDCKIYSEYFLLNATDVTLKNIVFTGKYPLQYVVGGLLENCVIETKDALWHAKNVVIKNSVVKSEYLAWYSEGLTFIDCTIKGGQPFCYCKNLTLINCKMEGCNLSFEKSEVNATITNCVDSIKNPYEGTIEVKAVGEIVRDDPKSTGRIIVDGVEVK